jgi:hypothetical protein
MTTEEMVKAVLEQNFNLTVEKIPEGESQTPDYLASDERDKYIIEVKEKADNEAAVEARTEALSNQELFEFSQYLTPRSVTEGVVRSGRRQINAYTEDKNSFRIVWVHCVGLSYEATREQIIAGIYGSTAVADWGSEDAFAGTCYYMNESQFFRYRNDLDAVVITCENSEFKICLNNHSPRYSALKRSLFLSNMEAGVCDPPEEDLRGEAFLVEGPIDRSDRGAVMAYLKEKYNTEKLMVMPMRYVSVHAAVPNEM